VSVQEPVAEGPRCDRYCDRSGRRPMVGQGPRLAMRPLCWSALSRASGAARPNWMEFFRSTVGGRADELERASAAAGVGRVSAQDPAEAAAQRNFRRTSWSFRRRRKARKWSSTTRRPA